jgi:hypothetical protein
MPISALANSVATEDGSRPQCSSERQMPFGEESKVLGWPFHFARRYSVSPLRALELFASAFGLAGMYLGSTTLHGAMCYVVAIPCLITCVYVRRLWGLIPLNLAQAVVIGINLFRTH